MIGVGRAVAAEFTFFLSDSSYVWSESIEVGEIWVCV